MPANAAIATPLDTPRLRIRPMSSADAPALYETLSDPAVMAFVESPFTAAQTRAFVREAGLCAPPMVYAVEERGGRVVGHAIFHPFEGERWEVGWVLRRDCWGRGYAREITAALIERARRADIPALVIECVPENRAARRVAEACGFKYAGITDGLAQYRLTLEEYP